MSQPDFDWSSDEEARKIRSLGGEGILTPEDLPELSAGAKRVEALLLKGCDLVGYPGLWRTADQIRKAAGKDGQPASEGLRRMRELRDRYEIERQRHGAGRNFLYRIKGPA